MKNLIVVLFIISTKLTFAQFKLGANFNYGINKSITDSVNELNSSYTTVDGKIFSIQLITEYRIIDKLALQSGLGFTRRTSNFIYETNSGKTWGGFSFDNLTIPVELKFYPTNKFSINTGLTIFRCYKYSDGINQNFSKYYLNQDFPKYFIRLNIGINYLIYKNFEINLSSSIDLNSFVAFEFYQQRQYNCSLGLSWYFWKKKLPNFENRRKTINKKQPSKF